MPYSLTMSPAAPGPVRFCRFSLTAASLPAPPVTALSACGMPQMPSVCRVLRVSGLGGDWEPSSQAWVPFQTLLCLCHLDSP